MNQFYARAPHRRLEATAESAPNAALLIDFDNVTMGIRSNLGQELMGLLNSDIIRGKVSVQRAYADWRRYPQYVVALAEGSIDLIFAPAYGTSKKNATDIRLAIDALELVFTRPEIGTFILLSGDSDFSSLVLKLKEYGKYVIGVGIQESSSDLLVQNCDEYYSYNHLSGLTSVADMKTDKFDPWELAGRAIKLMCERKDVMRSDRLKQVMLELDASFDEKSIGFSKFNRFLSEATSRGILELHKGANGQYEVAPARGRGSADAKGSDATEETPGAGRVADTSGEGRSSRGASEGRSSRSGRRRASRDSDDGASSSASSPRGRSRDRQAATLMAAEPAPSVDEDRLREAYDLLRTVVEELTVNGGSVRDSEVKRKMWERNPEFDERALGFSKFSRFLRQAHDEEVIDVQKGPEGNYRLSPAPSSPETPSRRATSARRGTGPRRGRSARSRGTREAGAVAEGSASEVESAPEVDGAVKDESEAPVSETPVPPETSEESGENAPPPPRRLGLFRRGGRSRKPPVPTAPVTGPVPRPGAGTKPPASSEPEAEVGAKTPASSEPETGAGPDLVAHLTNTYPGVGRKTAEHLVAEFGEKLFDVIDHEPQRLSKILPEHRARAVIAGRATERAAGEE